MFNVYVFNKSAFRVKRNVIITIKRDNRAFVWFCRIAYACVLPSSAIVGLKRIYRRVNPFTDPNPNHFQDKAKKGELFERSQGSPYFFSDSQILFTFNLFFSLLYLNEFQCKHRIANELKSKMIRPEKCTPQIFWLDKAGRAAMWIKRKKKRREWTTRDSSLDLFGISISHFGASFVVATTTTTTTMFAIGKRNCRIKVRRKIKRRNKKNGLKMIWRHLSIGIDGDGSGEHRKWKQLCVCICVNKKNVDGSEGCDAAGIVGIHLSLWRSQTARPQ